MELIRNSFGSMNNIIDRIDRIYRPLFQLNGVEYQRTIAIGEVAELLGTLTTTVTKSQDMRNAYSELADVIIVTEQQIVSCYWDKMNTIECAELLMSKCHNELHIADTNAITSERLSKSFSLAINRASIVLSGNDFYDTAHTSIMLTALLRFIQKSACVIHHTWESIDPVRLEVELFYKINRVSHSIYKDT